MEIEDIAKEIVDSAIKVHQQLGPGLLESAYQTCMTYELTKRGLKVVSEVILPIHCFVKDKSYIQKLVLCPG